jgi:RNA polymerase sigma-70 factor (ECF subfamily)
MDKALTSRDAHCTVQAGLKALSEEQQAVFVLHELDEVSAPDIADALGIPLNTVYSRLRLARPRFRDAVTAHSLRGQP